MNRQAGVDDRAVLADLFPPCQDTNGPERTVIQQDIRWFVSGDPFFREMSDAFAEGTDFVASIYEADRKDT